MSAAGVHHFCGIDAPSCAVKMHLGHVVCTVSGWDVTGQRDLFYLGHGGDIGLSINEASFLIPRMSKSFIIGVGKEYKDKISKSLCDKCPKFSICSWRRVDKTENE